MSNSRERRPGEEPAGALPLFRTASDPAAVALDYLKGKENPFDSLARPQRLDDQFLDVHVPELLASERGLLLEIMDHYRVDEYLRAADMPSTRVVVVLGERGTGKTHLLQSLCYRTDGKSQILVRPSYYDTNLPFEEYLLAQLVATLTAEDEVYGSRPIEDIAAALTRRLLRQTLRALGPTERLFALPGRRAGLGMFFGGVDRVCRVFDKLVEALDDATGHDLPQMAREHELTPEQCCRLIRGHLARYEVGSDLLAVLRRRLYAAMAQAALLGENEPLLRLLEGEYTETTTASTTRFEIVSRLCAWSGHARGFGQQVRSIPASRQGGPTTDSLAGTQRSRGPGRRSPARHARCLGAIALQEQDHPAAAGDERSAHAAGVLGMVERGHRRRR